MRPEDCAALHRKCFAEAPPPWRAEDFESLLAQPGVTQFAEPFGFILMRQAADEAEILTLAVDPAHRRRGIAQRLIARATDALFVQGVRLIFLEVAAPNVPAIALYQKAGFAEVGRRPRFYASRVDALVMRKIVTEASHSVV